MQKTSRALCLVLLLGCACSKDVESEEVFPCAEDGTCPSSFQASYDEKNTCQCVRTTDEDNGYHIQDLQEVAQPGSDLVWLLYPQGETSDQESFSMMTWSGAKTDCPTGFRLPTKAEMLSLLDGCDAAVEAGSEGYCNSCEDSSVCGSMFPHNLKAGWFWSADTDSANGIWCVNFTDGRVNHEVPNALRSTRCVR